MATEEIASGPGKTLLPADNTQKKEERLVAESLGGESSSKDPYDFFRSNKFLFHHGSDVDVRKSEVQPDTIYVYMTIPPDGGWGWVIVAISFVCSAVLDGICMTFGRLIPYLVSDLKIDIRQTITINSVMNGMYLLIGPVVSAVVNRFGFRIVAMIGGIISAIGCISGSFCSTWIQLTMCYGFMCGCGIGMVFAPATIVVGYYFDRYRALVTGIAICGSGVGVLMFSPIYSYCAELYGWRNTLRVQAGLCLFITIVSFLFRPLLPVRVAQIKEPEPSLPSDSESEQSVELAFASYSKFLPTRRLESEEDNTDKEKAPPIIEPSAPIMQLLKVYDPLERRRAERCCINYWNKLCCRKAPVPTKPLKDTSRRDLNLLIESRPLFRRDIFYTGGATTLPDSEANQEFRIPLQRPTLTDQGDFINYNMSMMHPPRSDQTPKTIRRLHIPPAIIQGLTLLLDVRLFVYLTFRLLVFVCFFYVVGSTVPYLFVTSRGDENGIPSSYTNWFVSMIGVSNTVFRLIAGLISFVPKINPTYLSAGFLLISGLFSFASGFIGHGNLIFQCTYCIMFGMGSAFFNTLKQVIFVNCLGLDNLTNAFGITSMVMGIGTLIGMPIAGILMDATGSSDSGFMYAGLSTVIAGVLQALVPLGLKQQQAKKERQASEARKLALEQRKKNKYR